ncbi:MAG TPA: acyl carrier protein [Gemmatimonadales bacterium]|nr:acyl carrier protein [Gemmatimonadales bacterium]
MLNARLRDVMAAALEIAPERITDDASPSTIETWDSVQHIRLVLALEGEFGIRFSADEIAELTSVRAIEERLRRSDGKG